MNPSILQQFWSTELSVLHTLTPSCKATSAPLCLESPFPRGVLHVLHLQDTERVLKVNRSYRQNLFTTVFSKGASLVGQMAKNPPAMQETWVQSLVGLGRFRRGGNGNPLQYFCLGNLMDRGAWWATVHGVAKSQTRLSDIHFTFHF